MDEVRAKGCCPLCGEVITHTVGCEVNYHQDPVYSSVGRGPTGYVRTGQSCRVDWVCGNGCRISAEGNHMPRVYPVEEPVDRRHPPPSAKKKAKPKTKVLINESPELRDKASRAKAALAQLGDKEET